MTTTTTTTTTSRTTTITTTRDGNCPKPEPIRPKVGVTAMLTHQKHLLVGRRKGSHCQGQLAFPGGHQEFWQTWSEAAVSEIMEETGLLAEVLRRKKGHYEDYLFVTDNLMEKDTKHYTTIWIPCVLTGENDGIDVSQPVLPLEPEKCEVWRWLTLDAVIQELLGKEDFTFDDIHNQDPEQRNWLPIKRFLQFWDVMGLDYPSRLRASKVPPGFWENLS